MKIGLLPSSWTS